MDEKDFGRDSDDTKSAGSAQPQGDHVQYRLPKHIRATKDSSEVKHPRNIIICLDGTGDRFDNDNSNIVHFVSCLKKHSPHEQMTYYQSGIGTYDQGGLKNGFGAVMDQAVGSGLGIHVKDAYRFLMQHYHQGDKICLFGFSRGAYTVRCLAGMLHKVGLLPASNGAQVNFAYEFYKDSSDEGWNMSADFKKTFCTDVNVHFLGLFDCVASVGFIPRKLPFSKSPTNSVLHFRHAMALDEHRAKFKPCQWQHEHPDQHPDLKRRDTVDNTPKGKLKRSSLLSCFGSGSQTGSAGANGNVNGFDSCAVAEEGKETLQQATLEAKFNQQDEANRRNHIVDTDVLEVWFRGVHADVGGGAVSNTTRHMLSRIPLRWMIRQCFECNTGILFKTGALAEQGLDVETFWPQYITPVKPTDGPPEALMEKYKRGTLAPIQRRSTFLPIGPENTTIQNAPTANDLQYIFPTEATEDFFDAKAPSHDQLVEAKGWWILEVWPVKVRVLSKDCGGWEKKVRFNLGRYRAIREMAPHIHWTVNHVQSEGTYVNKCRTANNTIWKEVV